MKTFTITTCLFLLLAALALAYNPHDPTDPVMFVRRRRADSRGLGKNNAQQSVPDKQRPNPNRSLVEKEEQSDRKRRRPNGTHRDLAVEESTPEPPSLETGTGLTDST